VQRSEISGFAFEVADADYKYYFNEEMKKCEYLYEPEAGIHRESSFHTEEECKNFEALIPKQPIMNE
jgi:hypothetical protein